MKGTYLNRGSFVGATRAAALATVQFTAAAVYPACQEAVRHLSNSRDWLIFFQIFLYKSV
jgi:hypothetical protein